MYSYIFVSCLINSFWNRLLLWFANTRIHEILAPPPPNQTQLSNWLRHRRIEYYPIDFPGILRLPTISLDVHVCCHISIILAFFLKDIRTSHQIWSKISDMINQLSVVQRKEFITAVNDYDPNILYSIRFHTFTSSESVDALIVRCLRLCNINGNTRCILCFLNNTFQCIGHSDLAVEVINIRSTIR